MTIVSQGFGPIAWYILPLTVTTGDDCTLLAYQGTNNTLALTLVDAAARPVNLSGKTVKFAAYVPGFPAVVAFTLAADVGGGGDGNVCTLAISADNAASADVLEWALHNVTDDVFLVGGTLNIMAQPTIT